ncbi:hypothetical protein QTQ03_22835 [Micromonospora sp. WMMA1363]|uniref:hypothetical protein n=1 Tax=Micromonospora sp. WMMA1363 TaxID=3053985 RepID=UPI00259CE93F|nr:hypothetical protein [Micromonospora sp. WMMA1363]MDM4722284.1 hypothetical protein [Micromonospora sp. WMMA1363]
MNTPTKLAAFAVALTVVFGAAYGVGRVTGPGAPAADARHDGSGHGNVTPGGGEPLTLGVDVTVPGVLTERPLPAPATSATVDFQHDGVVRTAEFTTIAGAASGPVTTVPATPAPTSTSAPAPTGSADHGAPGAGTTDGTA